jgi:hypothetical protein
MNTPNRGSLRVRMAHTHLAKANPIGEGKRKRRWRTLAVNERESDHSDTRRRRTPEPLDAPSADHLYDAQGDAVALPVRAATHAHPPSSPAPVPRP